MPANVLIVDDCSTVRQFIRMILTGEPSIDRIFEASSPDDAWRMVDSQSIDVITLDLNMPGADGLQLIGQLRRKSGSGIIVVSGESGVHDQAVSMGAVACFEKVQLLPDRARFIDSIRRIGVKPRPMQSRVPCRDDARRL